MQAAVLSTSDQTIELANDKYNWALIQISNIGILSILTDYGDFNLRLIAPATSTFFEFLKTIANRNEVDYLVKKIRINYNCHNSTPLVDEKIDILKSIITDFLQYIKSSHPQTIL